MKVEAQIRCASGCHATAQGLRVHPTEGSSKVGKVGTRQRLTEAGLSNAFACRLKQAL